MNTKLLTTKIAAGGAALLMALMPVAAVYAESTGSNSLSGNVTQTTQNQLIINSITTVRSNGTADGTFENGWAWVFDVSAPVNEQNLMMKFDNWMSQNMQNTVIPVANNVRFYSSQSSNAFNQNNAIYITAPSTYAGNMFLVGSFAAPQGMRRVQITVEMRIPQGTQQGTYNTNFGIKTQ